MDNAYEATTRAMAEGAAARHQRAEVEVRTFMDVTTSARHIELLQDIIIGHAGGKKFMVEYELPFEASNPKHKEILTDINRFFMSSYRVKLLPSDTVIVSNFDISSVKYLKGDRYEGFAYCRFGQDGGFITVDFPCKSDNMEATFLHSVCTFITCDWKFKISISRHNLLPPLRHAINSLSMSRAVARVIIAAIKAPTMTNNRISLTGQCALL
jgi:hypothetical protein